MPWLAELLFWEWPADNRVGNQHVKFFLARHAVDGLVVHRTSSQSYKDVNNLFLFAMRAVNGIFDFSTPDPISPGRIHQLPVSPAIETYLLAKSDVAGDTTLGLWRACLEPDSYPHMRKCSHHRISPQLDAALL
jgi:hypothetical protein